MKTLKRMFTFELTNREVVFAKRLLSLLMIPMLVFHMTSLNLALVQRAIAEDGSVLAEEELIEEEADDDQPEEEIKKEAEEADQPEPGEEVLPTPEITPEPTMEPVSSPTPDPTPAPTPTPVLEGENDSSQPVQSAENQEKSAPVGQWEENENGSMTVLVEEGGEYEYKDSGLKIKFTRIENRYGEITVEEIELTDEQVENLGALSNQAWDITSNMENGTFEYELTLPVEENVEIENAEIIYVENKEDLDDEKDRKSVV